MKTGTIAAAVGVVIIVLIVGYFALRPQATVAPTPSPTPAFEDVSAPTTNVSLQQTSPSPSLSPSPSVATSPATSPVNAVTIAVDESGFTPSTVTIAAGTTVTFVNNGQAQHWPASDVHPTHEILPEFDSKRGLTTGETYSHTFTKVGTWPMHDHLAPSNTGTITVR